MSDVSFLRRKDVKYIFHTHKLIPLLHSLHNHYRILTIEDNQAFRYHTLYLDTPDLKFYHDHHNGVRNRFKIRYRNYMETNETYLEIKEKNNKEQTDKKRTKVDHLFDVLPPEDIHFILRYLQIDTSTLKPTLRTHFTRITFVNTENKERITLDTNLGFEGYSKKTEFPFLVVCEQKLDKSVSSSYFASLLKSCNIYSSSFSKYCFGMVLLNPSVKSNRFKDKLLSINKLSNDPGIYNIAG